jgi:dolichol kinase
MSPWLTAIIAGLALGYRDPFTTLWFGAFLAGFIAMGGILFVVVIQVARVYGGRSEQFPYVDVTMSRREVVRGGIFLLSVGVSIVIVLVGRPVLYHGFTQ